MDAVPWPPEPAYKKLTDNVEEVEPEFYNTLTRLIDLPAEQDGELIMSSVSLSIDARDAIEAFRELVYLKKAELDGKERDWWLKTPAHVLRLCGTLAYLDWARRTAGQAASQNLYGNQLANRTNPNQMSLRFSVHAIQSKRIIP